MANLGDDWLGYRGSVDCTLALTSGGSAPAPGFEEGFGLELPTMPEEEDQPVDSDSSDGMQITGGSLRDELVRLVEGNPDVAANVLRAWISDAA